MSLEVRPAKMGCKGCYYDTHEGCPSEEFIDKHLPYKEWPCTIEGDAIIWVEINDTAGETTVCQG